MDTALNLYSTNVFFRMMFRFQVRVTFLPSAVMGIYSKLSHLGSFKL